jgi:hypothetical protein
MPILPWKIYNYQRVTYDGRMQYLQQAHRLKRTACREPTF